MNDTTQTLFRSLIKLGAGYLLARGFADEKTAEIISAGLLALFGVIWGVIHRTSGKVPPTNTPAAPLALLCLAGSIISFGLAGCSTSPVRAAYTAEASTQISVETVMTAWGDYVAQNHPTAATEAKVRDAYQSYQAAMVAAVDASEIFAAASTGDTNSIPASRAAAELARQAAAGRLSDLINLVRTFGVKL
jgi:hypothetical protein